MRGGREDLCHWGAGPVYEALRTVEVYDPATDNWTTKSDMPTARQGLSTNVINGKIYAIGGGVSSSTSYESVKTFSTVEEYDPMTDIWTTKSPMPTSRGFHSAHVVDGKIYIIGGSHESYPGLNHVKTVAVYDPVTDTWTQKGDMPRGIGAGSSSMVNGKIYTFGGYGGARRVDEYDPATDTWTRKSDMPTGRNTFTTSTLEKKIYIIGGYVVPTLPGYPGLTIVEIYDPATDTWKTATDMPTGRFGPRSSVVDGKIYVIGGTVKWITTASRTVEEYDPAKLLVKDFYLNKVFAVAGSDSVYIATKINDPTVVTILAEIEAPNQTPVDSLNLFDDGNHNDGDAGDSLFANLWPVLPVDERNYYIDLEVTRIETDTVVNHFENMALFTTIGPVVLDSYTITSSDTFPNPGNRLKFQFTLKNQGLTAIAKNITSTLICLDTCASLVGSVTPEYGDIAPGQTSPGSQGQYILFSNNSPTNTYTRFRLDIASNGYTFWSDTFSVFIYPVSVREMNGKQKLPSEFMMHQNYPNPFNPTTVIKYDLPRYGHVRLAIYDLLGRHIRTLVDTQQPAGRFQTIWNGTDEHNMKIGAGVYFCRLEAGDFVKVIKMALVK